MDQESSKQSREEYVNATHSTLAAKSVDVAVPRYKERDKI